MSTIVGLRGLRTGKQRQHEFFSAVEQSVLMSFSHFPGQLAPPNQNPKLNTALLKRFMIHRNSKSKTNEYAKNLGPRTSGVCSS